MASTRHTDAPTADPNPAEQAVHAEAPALENVPAVHNVQAVAANAVLNVPDLQAAHTEDPAVDE